MSTNITMSLILFFYLHFWKACVALLVAFVLFKEYRFCTTVARVPIVGLPFPGYFGACIGGVYFMFHGHDVISKAYRSGLRVFQVAMIDRMLVILTDVDMVDELCTTNTSKLSFLESIDDDFQVKYTISLKVKESLWHIPIISDQLTKKIYASMPAMREEITKAFDAIFQIPDDKKQEFTSVSVMEPTLRVFARLINFFLVGNPLCYNAEYIETCVSYAVDVAVGGYFIRVFPEWLKPMIAKVATAIPKRIKVVKATIGPMIRSRIDKMEVFGSKWNDKPDDFLQWLIDGSIKENGGTCEPELDIILRLMFINFAGVHTSSQMFVLALYELVQRPQYIGPLRDEIISMVAQYGYTATAFSKMSKLDSFTRECARYVSLGSIVTTRKAMIPFTFSDGLQVPKGTLICAPHASIHRDPKHYPDGDTFDGFRFHKMRQELAEGNPGSQQHEKAWAWTSTSKKHLFFGYGKHPCPGRFFASLNSKMMFHYLLTNYDFKLPNVNNPPKPLRVQTMFIPDQTANILFRRKSSAEMKCEEKLALKNAVFGAFDQVQETSKTGCILGQRLYDELGLDCSQCFSHDTSTMCDHLPSIKEAADRIHTL